MKQVCTGYPYEVGAEDPFRMPPPVLPPCPLCSGKVSRDDPAAQALDWGVRVAEAKGGESGFWKSAASAEVYLGFDRRMAGTQSEARVTLTSFVTQGLRAISALGTPLRTGDLPTRFSDETAKRDEGDGLNGGNGGNGDEPVVPGEEDDPNSEPRSWWIDDEDLKHDDPPGDKVLPSLDVTCCVIVFEYPLGEVQRLKKWGRSKARPREVVYWPWVGWKFQVLAIFKNTGNDPLTGKSCRCKCCQFRQNVDGSRSAQDHHSTSTGTIGGPKEEAITTRKAGEDTTEATLDDGSNREVRYGVGDPLFAYSQATKERSHEYTTTGPGDTEEPGPEEQAIPGLTEAIDKALLEHNMSNSGGTKETRQTVCIYYMQDVPGMEAPWLRKVFYNMCFTGQIWNKCPAWRKKREDKFRLYLSGYCGTHSSERRPTGTSTMIWDPSPDGDRQVVPDCEPPK